MDYYTYVSALAGIIWDSGAASITDCQVLVEQGITNPNSKFHSEKPKNTKFDYSEFQNTVPLIL